MFRGDTRAALYRPDLAGKELGISFQTLAELRQWATIHKWGLRQRQARARMLGYYTLYLVDEPLIDAWATISARVAAKGRHIATGDAWIAATAWLAGVPLVSHNRKDFQHIDGLRLISYGDP
jgi:tRNA(fMet)-specific endonuclease VapC